MSVIKITVSGPVGIGKTALIARIVKMINYTYENKEILIEKKEHSEVEYLMRVKTDFHKEMISKHTVVIDEVVDVNNEDFNTKDYRNVVDDLNKS